MAKRVKDLTLDDIKGAYFGRYEKCCDCFGTYYENVGPKSRAQVKRILAIIQDSDPGGLVKGTYAEAVVGERLYIVYFTE